MARLRDPHNGCAWDLKQDFRSIAPYTIEEAYEVAEAAERGSLDDLCDELGDLLLQVVFHAQMASEKEAFAFEDVVHALTAKLIRRHPHIFGDKEALTPEEVKGLWDQVKAEENKDRITAGLLHDVPLAIPSLTRAMKLQEKAGTVGFDWNDPYAVLAKLREELDEFEQELGQDDKARETEELGDILFAAANLARHRKIDPEQALRGACQKFTKRFAYIEEKLHASRRDLGSASLDEMEALWRESKQQGIM